jgi:hypothetical protein
VARNGAPDEVLAERVRSKIGRVLSHPRAIDVNAEQGIVELRGAVLRSERRRAIRCAESVRGVRAVRYDALRTYSDEGAISGFQPKGGQLERRSRQSAAMRGLRLGIAVMSGVVGTYRALKNGRRTAQRQKTENASSTQRESGGVGRRIPETSLPVAPS